jgi:hypothetical protein
VALNDVRISGIGVEHPLVADKFMEELQVIVRSLFEKYNGLPELVAVLAVTEGPHGPLDGTTMIPLGAVSDFGLTCSGRDKQVLSQVVKVIARRGKAVMLTFVSEAWAVAADTPEGIAEVKKWMVDHPEGIEDCPFKKEVVMLQIEHKETSPRHQLWFADITRDGETKSLGEFERQSYNDPEGRFVNLLPD